MTAPQIEIDDSQIVAAFNRLQSLGRDATPAMRAIAQTLLAETERNFATESGPTGPWPKLKNPDKRRKGGKILQDTGRLAASVTPFHSATEAGIGSNVAYAAIHQLGGDIQRAAHSMRVRHRTDAKGELIRTGRFKGKGLVFAKDSHKRALTRWFEVSAHQVSIPARPYMPVGPGGQLQERTRTAIIADLQRFFDAS